MEPLSIYQLKHNLTKKIKNKIIDEFNNNHELDIEEDDLFNLGFLTLKETSKKPNPKKVFKQSYHSPVELLDVDGIKKIESFLSYESKELLRDYLRNLPEFKQNNYTYINLAIVTQEIISFMINVLFLHENLKFNIIEHLNEGESDQDDYDEVITSNYIATYLNSNKKDELIIILKKIFYENEQVRKINQSLINGILESNNQDAIEILLDVFKAARLSEGLRTSILNSLSNKVSFNTSLKFFKIINDENLIRFSSVKKSLIRWCDLECFGCLSSQNIKTELIIDTILDCLINKKVTEYLNDRNPIKIYIALFIKEKMDADSCEFIFNHYNEMPLHTRAVMVLFLEFYGYYHSPFHHIGISYFFIISLLKLESDPVLITNLFGLLDKNIESKCTYLNDYSVTEIEEQFLIILDKYELITTKKENRKKYLFKNMELETTGLNYNYFHKVYELLIILANKNNKYHDRVYNYTCFEKDFCIDVQHLNIDNPNIRSVLIKACLSDRVELSEFCSKLILEKIKLKKEEYLFLVDGIKSRNKPSHDNIIKLFTQSSDDVFIEVIHSLLEHKKIQNRDSALYLIRANAERIKDGNQYLSNAFDKIRIIIEKTRFSKNIGFNKENILSVEKEIDNFSFFDMKYDVIVPKENFNYRIVKNFLAKDYTDNFVMNLLSGNKKSYNKLVKEFYRIIYENRGVIVEVESRDGVVNEVVGEQITYVASKKYQDINDDDEFEQIKNSYILGDKILAKKELIKKDDLFILQYINETLNNLFINKKSHKEHNQDNLIRLNELSKLQRIPALKNTLKNINEISFDEFKNFKHSFELICDYYKIKEGYNPEKENNELLLNYCMYIQSLKSSKYSNPSNQTDSNGLFFENIKIRRDNYKEYLNVEFISNDIIIYNLINKAFEDKNIFFDDSYAFATLLNKMNSVSYDYFPFDEVIYFISKGFIEKDFLYKVIFDNYKVDKDDKKKEYIIIGSNDSLLAELHKHLSKNYKSKKDKESDPYRIGQEIFYNSLNYMIDVESERSELNTNYTKKLDCLRYFPGTENFAKVLFKMGNITFTRQANWRTTSSDKKNIFSKILGNSIPEDDLTQEKFDEILSQYDIPTERLIEVAIYNRRYVTFIENYLKLEGLTELIYFFKVHASEPNANYSENEQRIIKRFSNIPIENFNDGQMDINWFKRAYQKVGKKNYELVYDTAKYTTNGGNHKRAQYFADAVLGKLKIAEVEACIFEKRNKDMVLAYGLLPLKNKKNNDVLKRYQNIQKFLKESKQFGAQRRANEKSACNMALNNLARNSGLSRTRFEWNMEVLLIEKISQVFSPQKVEDVMVHLSVDDPKTPKLIVVKGDKTLKSVPAKLKKNKLILELNEVKKELKAQYSRSKLSLEKAMNDEDIFSFEEIQALYKHPMISQLIKNILFTKGDVSGFIQDGKLISYDGETTLYDEDELKIAHPLQLAEAKTWAKWQDYIIAQQIKQPFKQVFREIYVMTDEELANKGFTERFAGYQIEPRKTIGVLKSRDWMINDYDGFEKVDHKQDIRIDLYCYADWFTPAEIEAPSLERVVFMDNKTNTYKNMEEISKVFFSEIMRDIDLVVSVAYVGGVDPLLNHTTLEMRKRILAHNLSLFKITNYEMDENYIYINGEFNRYSIHLGSGVVHISGKGMLPIFPVHSAQRGKIFLPFVDDDPKTSEIITKVLTLAKDNTIKDPDILKYL